MSPSLITKRLLRGGALLAVLALLLTGCLSGQQQEGVDLLNRDRSAYRIRTVRPHGHLQSRAQAWAERMAREGRIFHSSLPGSLPSCWRGVGENVGVGSSVAAIERAYMNSSGHRANILNSKYDFVGMGVASRNGKVYTVQLFMDGCT